MCKNTTPARDGTNFFRLYRWARRHTNHWVTALEPQNETSKSHTSPSKRVQGVDREGSSPFVQLSERARKALGDVHFASPPTRHIMGGEEVL